MTDTLTPAETERRRLRELDARVAQVVFEQKDVQWHDVEPFVGDFTNPPLPARHYSSDLVSAWMVVEEMRKAFTFLISGEKLGTFWDGERDINLIACQFLRYTPEGDFCYSAESETLPEAICLAALKANEA